MSTLHNAIMNITCDDNGWGNGGERAAYRLGHRDARHAAAELASEADSELRELRERCERLERERLALAMLAADKPMFDNPLTVYAAKEIRDRVLKQPIPGATK